MKYVGWFLFNLIVFIWSFIEAIQHNSFKSEGLWAWIAVLSGVVLLVFVVVGGMEIIWNIKEAVHKRRKRTIEKFQDILWSIDKLDRHVDELSNIVAALPKRPKLPKRNTESEKQ